MVPNTESETYKRANIKWLVLVKNNGKVIEGVTLNVSPSGVFVSCAQPLKLNDTCEMRITATERKDPLHAIGEVVWSNIHGQDDYYTPRGMGIKFTRIADKDRDFISTEAVRHLQRKDAEPGVTRVNTDAKRNAA
jgi:Tfp pilus assembly protein PilZ